MPHLFILPFDPSSLYICLCQALCSVLGIQWRAEDVFPDLRGPPSSERDRSLLDKEEDTLISVMKEKYRVL